MKTLKVPYIPGLERLSEEELNVAMEKSAVRGYISNVNWPKEFPSHPLASFTVARSDEHIFISYFVRGMNLKAKYGKTHDPVWTDSCVEFFVQEPGSKSYHNFEFNCIGTALAAIRTNSQDGAYLEENVMDRIIRYSSVKGGTFEEKEGVFEWSLIVGIPFSAFGFSLETLPQKLMVNFYKCADETAYPHYLSWSPINHPRPNFHLPEFFGELIFV